MNSVGQHASDHNDEVREERQLTFNALSRLESVQPVFIGHDDQPESHIRGPNVTDKDTVLSLARMGLDAYEEKPFLGEWQDVGRKLNYSQSFGWRNDGIRGHVFADTENSTVVIAVKGTSKGKVGQHSIPETLMIEISRF